MSDNTTRILTLAKHLLEQPDDFKYRTFRNLLSRLSADIDPNFTEFLDIVEDYKHESGKIPSLHTLLLETSTNPNDAKLNQFISSIGSMPTVEANSDLFISSCRQAEIAILHEKTSVMQRQFGTVLALPNISSTKELADALGQVGQMAYSLRDIANREAQSTASLALGPDALARKLRELEEETRRVKSKDYVFYDYGIDHFKDTIRILPGDLIIVGGFTSHGKSIELRRISYHIQSTYQANIFFLTFESTDKEVEDLMLLRHANNKILFPNTPLIAKNDFRDKLWTFQQEAFFQEVVLPHYYNSDSLGIVKFQYPGKSRYTMDDLRADMLETQRNDMDIDVLVVDYSTKMWPISSDSRKQPDTSDYNLLFNDLKQLGLNWRDARGQKKPIPVITAAQISRAGLKEAIKNENMYDESAFSHYSEIERSADTLTTVMMTPDMKAQNQARFQQIKGRKTGVQTEPVDLSIDIAHGEQVSQINGFSTAQIQEGIMNIF